MFMTPKAPLSLKCRPQFPFCADRVQEVEGLQGVRQFLQEASHPSDCKAPRAIRTGVIPYDCGAFRFLQVKIVS